MNFKIIWTFSALNSYHEEIDYILFKWNLKEVIKFEKLVINEIIRVSKNPLIGKLSINNTYSLTISKQTTLFYKINKNSNLIELMLFWNNLKNPNELGKLL